MIFINYFKKIDEIIENTEVSRRARTMIDNSETLKNYWHIGKILVEAQGGEKRAKYGNRLIKEWSRIFVEKYGKGYDESNLRRFRTLFEKIQNCGALRPELNMTHYRYILPLKTDSERNYYINQVILNNLSTRELIDLIKSKAYDRLSYKDKENIELITNSNNQITIEDMIKNPILIKVNDNNKKINELALHKYLINMLENKFLELGTGFALVGHEYKINIQGRTYKIDLLFFNYKLNSFVVVEIKTKEIKPQDISQIQFYVNYVDKNIKEIKNNKTIGILIVKKNNELVIEYTTSNDIYVTTYKLVNN